MNESTEKRSQIMRAVKGKDTAPEMIVRKIVHHLGYRYRLHVQNLPGKPDLVFSKRKKVIFVHGCFWHGHECKRGNRIPASNRAYWIEKIERNKKRDELNIGQLEDQGWAIYIIWECALKDIDNLKTAVIQFLESSS